jgi:tripartite ATP-independent transporter DctM subunit
MNYLLVLGSALTILLLLGVPVAFALALSAALGVISLGGVNLVIMAQQFFAGIDSFLLLAIPFFLLAGELMTLGGMTERLLALCNAVFGRFRGGLALSNVAASTVMAGISGSAVADTSAVGKVMIPSMIKSGYGAGFSAALTAAANVVGPIIPPSITFIMISVLTNLSPLKLFTAAIIPGILYALGIAAVAYWICRKRNYPVYRKVPVVEVMSTLRGAVWALILPLAIIGGIRAGLFNTTESSAFAVVYALFVGFFVYRELTLGKLVDALIASARTTGVIMIVLAGAQAVSWLMAYENAPQLIADWMLTIASNPLLFLLLVNIFLLIIGTFMENAPALVMLCPVLYPIAAKFGIDPYHFSMIVGINLVIGLITPPVAICLSIAGLIAKAKTEETNREILPFLAMAIFVVLLVTYIPSLSLWLPTMIGA